MPTIDDLMAALTAGEPPRIELEKNARYVYPYHYDNLPVSPRVAYIAKHTYIREEGERIRDFEYVIFPEKTLQEALLAAIVGEKKTISCSGIKIVHKEHILDGKRVCGGDYTTQVRVQVFAEIPETASAIQLHVTY
jgi:hypothetical protein